MGIVVCVMNTLGTCLLQSWAIKHLIASGAFDQPAKWSPYCQSKANTKTRCETSWRIIMMVLRQRSTVIARQLITSLMAGLA